jgi:hypothetical protein
LQSTTRSLPSLLISLLLFLSAAVLFVGAISIAVTAFLPLINGEGIQAQGTIYGLGFGFEALLLITATYLCFQKYSEHSLADFQTQVQLNGWHIFMLLLGASLALMLGYLVEDNKALNWLMLPLFTIPAVTLPIALIFGLGASKLQLGPRWRTWGIFGLGMTLSPFILFVIEIIILIFFFVIGISYLALQPELSNEIIALSNQLPNLQNDPEVLLKLIIPYALKPGTIIAILSFIALIVPFTEELIKPIGVWLFAGQLESPAQGFALGALSGAAFALVETINASGQTAEWANLLSTRIGTALLHITSTALMGWGIALAWKQRQYLKLVAIYFCSSILHGLWNASAIMYSYSLLAQEYDTSNRLALLTPFMLAFSIALVIILSAILILTNKRLNQTKVNDPIENTGNLST